MRYNILELVNKSRVKIILSIIFIISLFLRINITKANIDYDLFGYEDLYLGTVTHVFDDGVDIDRSLTGNENISSVVSESKAAPSSLVSTGYNAKHYTITFDKEYNSIAVVNVSSMTASGISRPMYVAKVERQSAKIWKVWFNTMADVNGYNFYNGYVRSFDIVTNRNIVTHSFYDDETSPSFYNPNSDISLTYTGDIASVISESKTSPDTISRGYDAKHYTITLNNEYDYLPINNISYISGSGRNQGSMSQSNIQKINRNTWKVWFANSMSGNGYTNQFEITTMPPKVAYISTSNIDYTTATANWFYSRWNISQGYAGGAYFRPQDTYFVQISTDSGFSNIVYSNGQNGAGTSMSLSGLQPGTIYYPRVRVRNTLGAWSAWTNGPAFTTLVNNPPNLDLLSCGATSEPTNYERARLTWNYTGTDEPGDQLVLRARWKRSPEDTNWQVVNLTSDKTGGLDMRNLISGYTYELQVSLNDNRNSHLGDRWKGCGTVTPPNYPEPTVEFSLNKTGDINTAVQKGGTLTLKTGDRVSSNWNITNNIGVVGNSCKISSINTIGGDNTVIYNNTGLGFTGNNVLGNNLPVNINDQRYAIRLECAGRTAKTPRSINETITLVVESYPTVSCNIQGDNTVKEGDTSIDINAQVGNVASYIWEAGPDSGDKTRKKQSGNSPIPNPLRLDYTGLDFGKYTPWVSVTKLGTNRTTPLTCGAITNFGSSNIKEVN